ncbi:MAG: type II toxin-antitoxin system VapC family toxin [Xanthobacteraceae bacterium]|nr:type II toxin-antitoxin system VapC family toxin [Xanthobacteraceae bacterium]
MTHYLVDTNVISATAPATPVQRAELVAWMDSHSADLFLSAITIAEVADGIAKAKREGARRKAADLSAWLQATLHLYGDRVLAFDSPTAEIAGALSDLARGRGHAPDFADIAIAATARRHDLTILSRNARHFMPMDVAVVDPMQALPSER